MRDAVRALLEAHLEEDALFRRDLNQMIDYAKGARKVLLEDGTFENAARDMDDDVPDLVLENDGETAYLSLVNTYFMHFQTLLGKRCFLQLSRDGHLDELLPQLIFRISVDKQEKIFDFFDDTVRSLQRSERGRKCPPEFDAMLKDAFSNNQLAIPVRPDFSFFEAMGVDVDHLLKHDEEDNPQFRLFHSGWDMRPLAKTGILITYWSPLFTKLLGSTLMRTATQRQQATVFAATAEVIDDQSLSDQSPNVGDDLFDNLFAPMTRGSVPRTPSIGGGDRTACVP